MPRPTPTQLVLYAALAVCVLVLGVRALTRGAPPPDGGTLVPTVAAAPPAPRPTAVVVHVVGAVRAPGLYRVRDGARVADALERAGGASSRAALDGVNLAAKVVDGQQVVVPRKGAMAGAAAPGTGAGAAAPAAGPVSLSGATLEQLDTLPGVGPATAQKILDHRDAHGAFRSVDDLATVPGIGPKKLEALREQVTP